jgi:HD-like signal output (HDOD) protein
VPSTTATSTVRAPDAAELTADLQAALASPAYRPPVLPSVALEVMALAGQQEAELNDVVKLLERDPVLAARVLALTQSAHYARRSPVVSLKQAAVRLGLEALTQLVLQAALALQVFRAPGFEWIVERTNRHATAVAHVTRDLCRRTKVPGDHAFTVGLLHDIGLSSCLLLITERPEWRRLPFSVLSPALDAIHADASGLLARSWKLPEPLPGILASHHQAVLDGTPQPINAALIMAEQLCWEAGTGIMEPPRDASASATDMPEQPLEGIDVNWASVVGEAQEVIGLGGATLTAARQQAFEVASSLGGDAAA